MPFDESFDLVVVGSGASAVAAACVAKSQGLTSVIIEKLDKFGGSTAYSGGVFWMPLNPYLEQGDSMEDALRYFEATAGDSGPASSLERRKTFIENSPKVIALLQQHGMQFEHSRWPDYYSDRPGGSKEGRSLNAPLFDLCELGEWQDKVGHSPNMPQVPVNTPDYCRMTNAKTSFKAKLLAAEAGWMMLKNVLLRRKVRGSGVAVQGRLLQIALREKLPIWLGTKVNSLIEENGRVVGVTVEQDGKERRIGATRGVLLNAGGYAHNRAIRDVHQPFGIDPRWNWSSPGDTGDLIGQVEALGGYTDLMDEAIWVPGSMDADGTPYFNVPMGTGKPHHIAVDAKGSRFADETCAYMEFGQRMIRTGGQTWAIMDSQARKKYPWGPCLPGSTPEKWIESGYFIRDDTIEGLAVKCGMDPQTLRETVDRFNGFARKGVDEEFHRGESVNSRWVGGNTHKPNPALGEVSKPPYYAVKLCLTNVGTAGGLMTDEFARVVRQDGRPIEGLYATGNSTASVMGRAYLGAGASIGASLVFGYVAAKHAAAAND
ncbi:MAG: FAD-binding protein [Sphingomonadales bacterium]|nr:FAD-binding protein [Sphingomonadales bacterium]MBU3993405.1 FAD-binding protein [Alphaproteobacteria bacterium]